MKWIALKTQQPPTDTEVLVSDGNYIHEAVKTQYGWSAAEPVSGYEWEFCLYPDPLYWAHKPKAPKVRSEDIPDPVAVKRAKYKRPPKKRTVDRMLHDEAKRICKSMGMKMTHQKLAENSPWVKLLEPSPWPTGMNERSICFPQKKEFPI